MGAAKANEKHNEKKHVTQTEVKLSKKLPKTELI
jgi:hypothetical protein